MNLLFPLWLALLWEAPDETPPPPDLILAAIEFDPPDGFEPAKPTPPALYRADHRHDELERARLILFVVPVPPDGTADDVQAQALHVSGLYTSTLTLFGDAPAAASGLEFVTRGSGREGATLAVKRVENRHVGLLLYGEPGTVDERSESVLDAARAVRRLGTAHPPGAGPTFRDQRVGFTIVAPIGFTSTPVEEDEGLLRSHLPYHFGLPVAISIGLETEFVDLSLRDAALGVQSRIEGASGDAVLGLEETTLGSNDAVRIDHASTTTRSLTYLVDLERHRVHVTMAAPLDHFERFEGAFDAAARTFERAERRLDSELGERYRNSEAGISIRPPLGFRRAPSTDAIVRLVETSTLPPRSELLVIDVTPGSIPVKLPDLVAFAERRLETPIANEGMRLHGKIQQKLLNGHVAVLFETRDDAGGAALIHWLIAAETRLFEIRFRSSASQLSVYAPVVGASVRTFESVRPTLAPDLAAPVLVDSGRASFRPPTGWIEADARVALAAFEEPVDLEVRGRVEIGRDPLPPENRLSRLADQYRVQVEADLRAAGFASVRTEGASVGLEGDSVRFTLRIAYSDSDGRALRELRHALRSEEAIYYVRATTAGERFVDHRRLFEACTESLDIARLEREED